MFRIVVWQKRKTTKDLAIMERKRLVARSFVVAFEKPNNIQNMFRQLVAGSGQSPVRDWGCL